MLADKPAIPAAASCDGFVHEGELGARLGASMLFFAFDPSKEAGKNILKVVLLLIHSKNPSKTGHAPGVSVGVSKTSGAEGTLLQMPEPIYTSNRRSIWAGVSMKTSWKLASESASGTWGLKKMQQTARETSNTRVQQHAKHLEKKEEGLNQVQTHVTDPVWCLFVFSRICALVKSSHPRLGTVLNAKKTCWKGHSV